VSFRAWILLGWFALVADVIYWSWQLGQSEHQDISTWHATLNLVLFLGAPVLFVALLILSLLALRRSGRARRLR
jgi:hypothetical protein